MNIYIYNLSSTIQDEHLENMFSVYGSVQSVEISKDIISGESRGYGFIEMADNNAAQKAIDALNQLEIGSLMMTVQENRN